MSQQRLNTIEKQILLDKVISQIDVAIIAVDAEHCITLLNPAAEKLLHCRFDKLRGWPIKELGLHQVLQQQYRQVVEIDIAQHKKKVYIHTDEYFEQGVKQQLIFISDIAELLRDEERMAWKKLLRVLSHEINNSLAPIASISETLTHMVKSSDEHTALAQDLQEGLAVITERSHSLNEFIKRYQQLTRLPSPSKTPFDLTELIHTVAQLFESTVLELNEGEQLVYADRNQLQQVLVNLFKNANESMHHMATAKIVVSYRQLENQLAIYIVDQGCGISNMDNLFVPFYTTKEQGSGIGLVLSRQIIVNHCGDLTLDNRVNHDGVRATIYLPISNA